MRMLPENGLEISRLRTENSLLREQLETARKALKLIAHPQAPRREIAKDALAQIDTEQKGGNE